jgi:L-alanine-DL-glutamate epimerase-like enolase superfamily enzyme
MPRIEALALYELTGARDALVAPNAYAGVRPAESRENLLLLLSDDGRYGVTNWTCRGRDNRPDVGWLTDLDPRALFVWRGGQVVGRAPAYAGPLSSTPALDVALLDLCAQFENVPMWRLLGAECRSTVPAYDSTLYFEDMLDPDSTVESVAQRALTALSRGHRALKIKVGRGLKWMPWPDCTERDIQVCQAVRAAVGPEVRLMVDANKGYTGYIEDAVDFLAETAECGFVFAEELVEENEVNRLRAAMEARGLSLPLAGGEDAATRAWCERTWPHCRLDVLQMDICRTGLMEYLAIAAFARDHGLKIAPHNFGSQLGIYVSLQLGKTLPEYIACECDDSRFNAYQAPGYVLHEGSYTVPDTPGLGIQTHDPRVEPVMAGKIT